MLHITLLYCDLFVFYFYEILEYKKILSGWTEAFVDISGCLVDRWCIPNTLPLYKLMVKEIPHTTTTILCIFEVDLVKNKF